MGALHLPLPVARRDADRRLPVVGPVTGVGGRPCLRLKPPVGVDAGGGKGNKGGQVGKDPTDKVIAVATEAMGVIGVEE